MVFMAIVLSFLISEVQTQDLWIFSNPLTNLHLC